MPTSKLDSRYEFTKERWVVSILNTGSRLTGHAIILLEGLNTDGTLFVGQYDIRAKLWEGEQNNINPKGYVSEIVCRESPTYTRNYEEYDHNSLYILNIKKNDESQSEVEKLISEIKEDKKQVDAYAEYVNKKAQGIATNKVEPVLYQLLGTKGLLVDSNKGCNCANWCIEKLKKAGVDDVEGIYDKKPVTVANKYLSYISKYRGTLLFTATSVVVAGAAYLAMSESELASNMRDKLPTPFN